MPSKKSRTIAVQVNLNGRRRGFELTTMQQQGLETVNQSGRLSDAIPFATARSMTNKGLMARRGAEWFITSLGKQVRGKIRAKRKMEA